MSLLRIVLKSLRQHALSTTVTSVSIALACGLLMAVWAVKEQARETFTRIDAGFDGVLGARSSKLQLVLNAVFHLEASPANISWNDYESVKTNASVQLAVPIAMGDNYRGYRVVGTSPEMFTHSEYAAGRRYTVVQGGRLFDPTLREAVVGNFAARKLKLKVGDKFHPYHGLNFDEKEEHAETYVVVGILEPSNTPADRVLWIPLAGVQHMSGHAAETASDLSAVLVKLRSPLAGRTLELLYNRHGNRLTFAWPIGATMAELLNKVGWFDRVLALVAGLVAIVAAGSVLASIYNSMNERRRQIAILRALGARRATVASTIVLEAIAIAVLGAMLGFAIYAVILSSTASIIRAETGVVLEPFAFDSVFIWAPLGLIGLSALAGIVPAFKAYRTEVAENLAPLT
jgi:putative ABC transport system permease protein